MTIYLDKDSLIIGEPDFTSHSEKSKDKGNKKIITKQNHNNLRLGYSILDKKSNLIKIMKLLIVL